MRQLARVLGTFAVVGPLVWWIVFLASGELTRPISLLSDVQIADVFLRDLLLGFNKNAMLFLLSYAASWMIVVAILTGFAVVAAGASHSWLRSALVGLAMGMLCSIAIVGVYGSFSRRFDLAVINTTARLVATLVCCAVHRCCMDEPERTPA